MKKILSLILVLFAVFFPQILNAEEASQQPLNPIHFFYSTTCTHCQDEIKFLEKLQIKYPSLEINQYEISDPRTIPLLKEFSEKYKTEKYIGVVPLTFIGNSYVVGYKTDSTTGATIERLIFEKGETIIEEAETCDENAEECVVAIENLTFNSDPFNPDYEVIDNSSSLSFFGVSAESLSLPVLSVVLGFLDGFNVCSLGALMLILSLVFTLKDRKKVALYGGLFLIITGITYAALIFIWFSLFELFAPYVNLLEIIIGAVGLIGGAYFIRQYIRFKKYGPTCDTIDTSWIRKATVMVQNAFKGNKGFWIMSGAVILFAFIVTVIEFPCSAVIPVAFAGILTSAGISAWTEILYLGIFMLFYLIDEIIIFSIGVYTLRLWTGSSNMTLNLALVQAILFIGLGVFYIGRLLV